MSADDARRAIKLADGSYLIRTGCCRPGVCAPYAGIRCCLSARCECEFPTRFTGRATVPPVIPDHMPHVRKVLIVGGMFTASAATMVALVLVIAAHIVAVVVAGAATLATLAGVAWLRRGRRGPKYIVNIHNQ